MKRTPFRNISSVLRKPLSKKIQEISTKNSYSEPDEEIMFYSDQLVKVERIRKLFDTCEETVTLTDEETNIFADEFEFGIFDVIRSFEDVDNINWLVAVIDVYKRATA